MCSERYGFNGWLGVAQIWVSGDHITQGTVKVNDSYFNTATYNTPAWRNLVMCQEVGHTLGLHHNDEDFNTTNGTCMDYSNNPEPNQHPNQHDYDQLQIIYDPNYTASPGHLDSTTTVGASSSTQNRGGQAVPDEAGDTPAEWGVPIRSRPDGRPILYRRDVGPGRAIFTWVFWADLPSPGRPR